MTPSSQHYLVITALGADRPGIVNTLSLIHISDLLIVMKRTSDRPRPAMPATVWVQVEVADSPHLIERFTALFNSHEMNIAELVSRTQPAEGDKAAQLFIQITAHSPASQNSANIEQAFKALCTELNAQGSINVVNYSQHDEQDGVK